MCKQSRKNFNSKIGETIPYEYSMSTIWAFDNIENKDSLHRREDCTRKFYIFPREHAANVINSEKKKMLPLTEKI